MNPLAKVVLLCLLLVAATAAAAGVAVQGERPHIEYAQKVDGNRSACFSQRAFGVDTIKSDDMLLLGTVVKTESRKFGRWFYNVVTFEVSEVVLGSRVEGTVEFLTSNTFTLNTKGEAEMRESTVLPWVCLGDQGLVLLRPNTVRSDILGWSELVYAGFLAGPDYSRDQAVYREGDVRYDGTAYLAAQKAGGSASPFSHLRIARQADGTLADDIRHFQEGLAARTAKGAGHE